MKRITTFITLLIMTLQMSAQSTSDIANIINKFITNNQDGAVAWSLYNDNLRLERYDSNLSEGNIHSYKYRYTSALTMSGQPIFRNEVGDGGVWGVTLHGARAGAFVLSINTFILYRDPEELLHYLINKLGMKKVRNTAPGYADYSAIYSAKGSYLKFSYSQGATGCGDVDIYVGKTLNGVYNL